MNKIVLVINGRGGVGKDTLCSFIAGKYPTMNISAIDPVKKAAALLGWNGSKDNTSRKFLSDLKLLSAAYNDYPTTYLIEQYSEFLKSEYEVLFLHIREKEEIAHFVEAVGGNAGTLLIRRNQGPQSYGNYSDDHVEDYDYDFIYNNDKPLEEARDDFITYFEGVIAAKFQPGAI